MGICEKVYDVTSYLKSEEYKDVLTLGFAEVDIIKKYAGKDATEEFLKHRANTKNPLESADLVDQMFPHMSKYVIGVVSSNPTHAAVDSQANALDYTATNYI